MKSIVYSPDEVCAAVEPSKNPKRHVFLISTAGDIICCDIENGWVRFVRPQNCTLREWAKALRAAISAMEFHARVARSIYDDFMDTTQPNINLARVSPTVIVAQDRCPTCGEPPETNSYPYCAHHSKTQ